MGSEFIIITGANSGIGLALTAKFQERGSEVIALCRKSSDELDKLGVKVIEGVDVTNNEQLILAKEKVVQMLNGKKISVLINNAGVYLEDKLEALEEANLEGQFRVNAIAPIMISKLFIDEMDSNSKIIMISSRLGSITDNSTGGYYGYRASKAALNVMAKSLAIDLKPKRISVGIVHPGYVKTKLTNWQGEATAEQSAAGIMKRIDELNTEFSGYFRHANGANLPW